MIKAIIFDRDGVLIDSEGLHINSAKAALAELGVTFDENDAKILIGRHPSDYREQFLKKYNVDWDDYAARQKTIYYKLLDPNAILIKESAALARILKKKGFKIGLATSSGRDGTIRILKETGLTKVFDAVIAKEDCNERKPSPESYLLTARKLGVNPKECIAIEDTSLGLEAAKRAGMKCIVIKTSILSGQTFPKADLVLDRQDLTFEAIKALIGN